ncbi:hypothetical protein IWQ62_000416 [Dispira parvispora]|uniref:N-terminal of MaoC-like dehydratase domain-containing protein n=1 Tax=Dispira parvispora TaxID=1520584 RepID=A0A9W8AUH9_9FUNG|nr:hypothetical protein IWQ62_000416 [Dispira parvispora]
MSLPIQLNKTGSMLPQRSPRLWFLTGNTRASNSLTRLRWSTIGRRNYQSLETWIPQVKAKCTTQHDQPTSTQLRLLGVTLDSPFTQALSTPQAVVPPNWHLIYFPDYVTEAQLSSDGYDAMYAPPSPFDHRVWAGGQLEWSANNSLRVGQSATLTTECENVEVKESARLSQLVLVNLKRTVANETGWALTERRTLAYMVPPTNRAQSSKPSTRRTSSRQADFSETVHPTEIMLFRYSALTFNSHRIHYDQPYATQVEGHPGILVHGPLTCTLLLHLVAKQLASTKSQQEYLQNGFPFHRFTYRALSPLVVNQPFTLGGKWSSTSQKTCELWVTNHQGGLAMAGTLELY